MSRVKDAFMSGGYAGNGSIILSSTYTKEPVILIALYIDDGNQYLYAVDEKQVVRRMSITRNVEHARRQFRIAKSLIHKKVFFGVTDGWSPDVWFNEIVPAD